MVRRLARWYRSSPLLHRAGIVATLALSACVAEPGATRHAETLNAPSQTASPAPTSPGRRVAILLPLTGPAADVGQSLLKAAQLSLAQPGSPPLDQQDTGGTPEGAVIAVKAALAGGAGLILGPLTAAETGAAGPLARAAGVPMLAFTSDQTQAQPGVWTLGITPAQQVRRLVLAVQAENKTRIAAVMQQNAFGNALAAGLVAAASSAGLPPPKVVNAPSSFSGINAALKDVSDFANRRGAIEAAQQAARAGRDADSRRAAAEIGKQTPAPPPMDALFLGITGDLLGQAVPLLAFYDVGPDQLRILGPATWAREAARQPALSGAWYAAPDPKLRQDFEQQYAAKYGVPPRDFSSIAFDAAGIARAVATPSGFPLARLIVPDGFGGSDGLLTLMPDGQVRRGLAIFQIDRGGAHMVQPAPSTQAAPGI